MIKQEGFYLVLMKKLLTQHILVLITNYKLLYDSNQDRAGQGRAGAKAWAMVRARG